jgi:hypothetical protein
MNAKPKVTRDSYVIFGFVGLIIGLFAIGYVFDYFAHLDDNAGLPCDKYLKVQQIESLIKEHKDTISQIENLGGTVSFGGDYIETDEDNSTIRCPGKTEIWIYYGTEEQAQKIRNLIGDSFFGSPYRMINT